LSIEKAYDKIYMDIWLFGGDKPENTGEQKKRK